MVSGGDGDRTHNSRKQSLDGTGGREGGKLGDFSQWRARLSALQSRPADRSKTASSLRRNGGLRWPVWIGRIGRLSPDVAGPLTLMSGEARVSVTLDSARLAGKRNRTDGRLYIRCLSVRVPAFYAASLTLSSLPHFLLGPCPHYVIPTAKRQPKRRTSAFQSKRTATAHFPTDEDSPRMSSRPKRLPVHTFSHQLLSLVFLVVGIA
jgi:hypothetical protein